MADQKPSYPMLSFQTPPGRLLAGNLKTPSTQGYKGKVLDTAVYWFCVGINKREVGAHELLQQIVNHTWQSVAQFPQVQAKITAGPIGAQIPTGYKAPFAWKIDDGDAPDEVTKEGRAGCWLFKFGTTIPFKVLNDANDEIPKESIPLGHFVEVYGTTSFNGHVDDTTGIYMNPKFVRHAGYGPTITPGITAAQAFGDSRPRLAIGASTAPVANVAPMPGQPPAAAPGVQLPQQTPPAAYAPPVQAPPPAYTPPVQAPVQTPTTEAWAAMHGVPHYPNFRFNPATRAYDPDQGNGVSVPAVPAGATLPPASYTPPSGAQGTVSPSNPPAVQPHTAFAGGPPAVPR